MSRSEAEGALASLIDALDATVREAIAKASAKTNGGPDIDAHQPHAERVPYLATEGQAAKCPRAYADELAGQGGRDPQIHHMALGFAAEGAANPAAQLDPP